jgi:hypothetical protein
MVVSGAKLQGAVQVGDRSLGVVHAALTEDAFAKGSIVTVRTWAITGKCKSRFKSEAWRGSRQKDGRRVSLLTTWGWREKTRQMSLSVCLLDRIFYSLPG